MKNNFFKKFFSNEVRREIDVFFLALGITMLLLNITTWMNFSSYLNVTGLNISFPSKGFYVSVSSSLFLIAYTLYSYFAQR